MAAGEEDRAAALRQAQECLKKGDFAAGLALAQDLLAADPADSDALYIAAVACRYLKDFDSASQYLAKLHAAMPEYGRAWQEAGHLARTRGDRDTAIESFRRATVYNPALQASWKYLAELAGQAGRQAESRAAQLQLKRLNELPRELLAVTNHLYERRLGHAEEICRHYLQRNPKNVEGMRLLARIGVELGILDDAEFLLESAREFEPDSLQVHIDYVDVLRRRQKFGRALEEAE